MLSASPSWSFRLAMVAPPRASSYFSSDESDESELDEGDVAAQVAAIEAACRERERDEQREREWEDAQATIVAKRAGELAHVAGSSARAAPPMKSSSSSCPPLKCATRKYDARAWSSLSRSG